MLGLLARLLLSRVAIGALALLGAFEAYQFFGPTEDSLGFMRRNLAERVCTTAVQDLPRREKVRTVGIADLPGDYTAFVAKTLRAKLEAAGIYELIEESFFRQLLRELGRDDKPVVTLDDAVATARRTGVDAIVFGAVPEFSSTQDRTILTLELRMAERDSGQAVFAKRYHEEAEGSPVALSYWRARIADSSKGRRIFLWIVFALLLPIVTAPVIRRLTAEESNAVNLVMLIGYTAVDMIAALLLTGFWIPTLWTVGILVLALGASVWYNYRVASLVEEMSR